MSKRIVFGIVAALTVVVPAILRADADTAAARGAEILAPFKQQLKQALVAGLQQGPVSAISVCREQAPSIAADLSIEGIVVGRSSHRLRNPSNAAPDWVVPVLDEWVGAGADRSPVVVALPGGRSGYVEAIETQPLCLACHGTSLAPEIAERIAADYPDDRATGFEVGDLRGVFWAEFPSASAAAK